MQLSLKKLKSSFSLKKKNSEKREFANPYRDWAILCIVAAALLVGVFGASAYFFAGIQSGKSLARVGGPTTHTKKIDQAQLEKVLKIFTDREDTFNAIKNKPREVVDPSM